MSCCRVLSLRKLPSNYSYAPAVHVEPRNISLSHMKQCVSLHILNLADKNCSKILNQNGKIHGADCLLLHLIPHKTNSIHRRNDTNTRALTTIIHFGGANIYVMLRNSKRPHSLSMHSYDLSFRLTMNMWFQHKQRRPPLPLVLLYRKNITMP